MSLVGTRPILQDELRQYELHHRARIAIKPGITGMWQVSGRSDITDLLYLFLQIKACFMMSDKESVPSSSLICERFWNMEAFEEKNR